MIYSVHLDDAAEADLKSIFEFISERASAAVAQKYIDRLLHYISGFDVFPMRGRVRNEIRHGLRIAKFERRVSIAFVVEGDKVVILRVLYGGRRYEAG